MNLGDEESAGDFYKENRRLIKALMRSIVVNNSSVVSDEDLEQAGALALIVALRSYDPSVGSLQSYIRKCIRNALLEQANVFSSSFTTDEKQRRRANLAYKLRNDGASDEEIMTTLGIRKRDTLVSLFNLLQPATNIDRIEVAGDEYIDESSIWPLLDEIGLEKDERRYVELVLANHNMDEIERLMGRSRSYLYNLKAAIVEKVLDWGR